MNGCGRIQIFSYNGDEIPDGMNSSFFSWKIVSVYLLTDCNYVFKS